MGSRGLSSKGSSSTNVAKLLGKKGEALFVRYPNMPDAMRVVNPNYDEWWWTHPPTDRDVGSDYYKWGKNCALCSTAGVLQIMGYDVEAMPRDVTWRGFDSVFDYNWSDYSSYLVPGDVDKFNYSGTEYKYTSMNNNHSANSNSSVADVADKIDKQMQSWGVRSTAIMNVAWNNGGAHAIVALRGKTRSYILDFQTHKYYTVEGFFKTFKNRIDPQSVGLYRMDNQKLKNSSSDAKKVVRRRKKRKGGKQ